MGNISQSPLSAQEVQVEVDAAIEAVEKHLQVLNRTIWSNPELGQKEVLAHDSICLFFESLGYDVKRHAYGIETAFEVLSGSGGRLINYNAEYDCLPGIGHACGHNLIATSSIAAFHALSTVLKKFNIPGRTQLLGTPDEEGKGGKIMLLDGGAYKGVDVSLMAHPSPLYAEHKAAGIEGVAGCRMIARQYIEVEFRGKNTHAGGTPWMGINALDAAVAAYNNISLLRQQILPDERIHAVFLDGEKTINVIPAQARVALQARSLNLNGLQALVERVINCAKAAATATGCEVDIQKEPYYADVTVNETLCERYQENIAAYGKGVLKIRDQVASGSSDVGNVGYVVPALHALFGIPCAKGVSPHSANFTDAAGTDAAYESAIITGKTLALVGFDVATKDEVFQAVYSNWQKEMART
ncbi:uncharacterized protein N7458_009533 [Penicillium daleae]|uniref:Peptidase M20 domain-containing protein 2 n=1 Tax=Penicillium daleae TaxID=63821 RepID=A0AAD6FYI4_9EURO|nr:uncharacterized protein N7458_009533 [Penicillium daleae]KAJ5438535.1 hypothetical protein N7458_009533 [Penicillium daleae]